ncbi:fimbrial protein [Serratia marcescens]|nr:fimbrial protein [Serratia marcescens]
MKRVDCKQVSLPQPQRWRCFISELFKINCSWSLCVFFLFSCFFASAADMQIKGALIEPPACQVVDGGGIDVDFGDRVGIKKINGVNYTQKINYSIACQPGIKGWDLVLELVGKAAGFDAAALQSNKSSLGIRILNDKKPFLPGTTIVIDKNAPPVLEAVPVAEVGSMLVEGKFSATATLLARYQ